MKPLYMIVVTLPSSGTKMAVTVKEGCFALVSFDEKTPTRGAGYWNTPEEATKFLDSIAAGSEQGTKLVNSFKIEIRACMKAEDA
jgi:hypothetical protein